MQQGDFAPWNLLRMPGGPLGAVDWEYGNLEAFSYLDIAHYILQVSSLIYRRRPSEAEDNAAEYVAREPWLALSSAEARVLTRFAAYDAHLKLRDDGRPLNTSLQTWRQEGWKGRACNV